MSNVSAKKVFIQIESEAEQQEHIKNQRKTLKVLQQGVAIDKENLAGRPQIDKLHRLKAATEATLASNEHSKRKKIESRSIETQTSPTKKNVEQVTVDDLTSESEPSEFYWKKLAEKRREALEETLEENQHLHERIENLEAELDTSRAMLAEAQSLVEILKEMINENETEAGADTRSTTGSEDDNQNDTPTASKSQDDRGDDSEAEP